MLSRTRKRSRAGAALGSRTSELGSGTSWAEADRGRELEQMREQETQSGFRVRRIAGYGGAYHSIKRLRWKRNASLLRRTFNRTLQEHISNHRRWTRDLPEKGRSYHCGSYKINNALAQAMIARRLGCSRVVAATGAGQHGVATAAACAKFSLECTVFMGTADKEKQFSNVLSMKLFGAQVKSVEGTFKDASTEAIRNWVGNLETTYYLSGTVVGPHPSPLMVREFQSVIGKETRRQANQLWGGKPDVLVACVGSGSNALGLFHEFVGDEDVRLVGIEAAGLGLDSGKHSATLAVGDVGVYHGSMSYLLQDDEGQILKPHSVGVG
uniref:tryptophan synthase n=1 Tax=Brassica oleracea var. oleracea TaxID=109376 RepID=A0A0D3E3B6_BRAOL